MLPWRHILVATDFSACSEHAMEAAIELALKFDSKLTLVHVWEVPVYVYSGATFSTVDVLTPIQQAAEKELRDTLERVRHRLPDTQSVLRKGLPSHEVVEEARVSHADLLVIGTHGRRGAAHFLLGSVAERIVQRSPAPVLTVRPPDGPAAHGEGPPPA